MPLSILLLQARTPDDPAGEDERRSFAEKARLSIEQIVPHSLLDGPPSLHTVRNHDALMVGGSGDFYVSKQNLPDFLPLLGRLREVVEDGHPMLASCFGFQLLVKALGGEVIFDADNMEVGTYQLTLTPAGEDDELMGNLPKTFWAQMGHKDRTRQLPAGCLNLASSQNSPYQAIRVPGKPIWATQFHPELDVEDNRRRFRQYASGYAVHLSEEERQAALDRFVDSPETEQLISQFLTLVFA